MTTTTEVVDPYVDFYAAQRAERALEESIKEARASLALKRAKAFLPLWTNLVRSIARNQRLKVELTGGTPRTDGKTVWLRVPIELADFEHERSICSKWDEASGEFLCKACNVELQADVNLFHEVGHLVAGSFGIDDPDEELIALCKARWPKVADKFDIVALSLTGRKMKSNENSLLARMAKCYPDGWGFLALNLVEDSYVNASMIQARPGLGLIFASGYMQIFRDGDWKNTQPPVVQAMAAWSLMASGQPETMKYLSEEVVDLVTSSSVLSDMAERFLTSGKTSRTSIKLVERFKMSVMLLEEFERLGLIPPPEEPEDEPEGSEDGESEGGDKEGDSDCSSSGSEDSEDSESSTGGTTSGSPSEEEDQDDVRSDEGSTSDDDSEDDPDGGSKSSSSGDSEVFEDEEDTLSDSSPEGDESKDSSDSSETDGKDGETRSGFGDASDSSKAEEVDFSFESVRDAMAELTGHEDFGKGETVEEALDALSSDSLEDVDLLVAERLTTKIDMDGVLEDHEGMRSLKMDLDKVKIHDRNLTSERENSDDYSLDLAAKIGAAQKLRLMFTANKKSGVRHDLTSGRRLDRRTMGSRIPSNDDRIFSSRSVPKKRDWTVLVGIDISGSTTYGKRLETEKRVAFAMSELLDEVGIPFSVYAHTGSDRTTRGTGERAKERKDGYDLIILPLKVVSDTWRSSKHRVANLVSGLFNLDGHTMQAYRKLLEAQEGKDKLLIYFTDGSMPAENASMERPLLIKEVQLLRRKGINLVCISVDNEEPLKYGIDTIRVDGIEDLPRMIAGIATRLGMKI